MKIPAQEEFLRQIGERIRALREEKGLRQEDFEDGGPLSLAVRSLQEIEYGNANPRIYTLYKIAKRCGVSVREIIDF
jgi:transcriptional regulator with XRE-family HTH domain